MNPMNQEEFEIVWSCPACSFAFYPKAPVDTEFPFCCFADGSENINVKAAFIHVLGDLIQSIGSTTGTEMEYKL